MGIEFSSILSHTYSLEQLRAIPTTFTRTRTPSLFRATDLLYNTIKSSYINLDIDTTWKCSILNTHHFESMDETKEWGSIEIQGPAGMMLLAGKQAIDVWNITRWGTFLTDSNVQRALRIVCRELAMLFGSETSIYLPDSSFSVSQALDLVPNGLTYEEILAWLQRSFGAPLSVQLFPENIMFNDDWNGEHYFIDHFNIENMQPFN